jgi:glutamine amidotransferase
VCRLFAYLAPEGSTAERELGERGILSFLSLAQIHGDGWGWAGVQSPGDAPLVHKSTLSASKDPAFRPSLRTGARAAMVHLRWATMGLEVETDNTHPFLADGVSFQHNGSLKPIERVRALLSPEGVAGMHGDTDSEMYFALIREKMATGVGLPAATLATIRDLRDAFPESSLNAILLDSEQLIVVHASARSVLPETDVIEIMQYDLPDEHIEDYFALRVLRKPDGTILIGSTGVAEPGWEPLLAESVSTIRLADGRMTTASLFSDD